MSSTDAEKAMDKLTDKATYRRLEKDLSAVKNDIATLTDQITDALDSFAGVARKKARRGYKQARANMESVLSDAMSDASERGSAALSAAQEGAYSLEESLEDAISERPLAAVGFAIGLGFLIGATWRR